MDTNRLQRLLGRLFPLMAFSGLLLAGWGLIVTPDDIKSDAQGVFSGAPAMSLDLGAVVALSPQN